MDRQTRKNERERKMKSIGRSSDAPERRKPTPEEVDRIFGFDRMGPFRAGLAKLYFLYMSKQFAEADDSRDILEDIFSWKSLAFFAVLFAVIGFVLYAIVRVIVG